MGTILRVKQQEALDVLGDLGEEKVVSGAVVDYYHGISHTKGKPEVMLK